MQPVTKLAFVAEISQAQGLIAEGKLAAAFTHLERAHVLGQLEVVSHVQVHWLMFKVEVSRRRVMAAVGQLLRIVLGGLGSAVGVVPVGNTGGSDISMFKRLPIAPDLQDLAAGRTADVGQAEQDKPQA
ncbi:MAG: DUF3703 domain-containing protein [Pseudomonas sp.]|uniref:DUF3703 domain-containing protein n=1 Tax=Pseudomonas sp. TaxID=306 RepID=UPI002733F9EF|nr:DUF3703 domain-containing protein [Pseudomonas sp.]MDP3848662.1 DUF3703 domain-containing protein [Pseudomonas sp.]